MIIKSLRDKKAYGHRMKAVRKKIGASMGELAENLGMNPNLINEVENSISEPGYSLLMKLNETYDINPNYILLGHDDIFLDQNQKGTTDSHDVNEQGKDVANLFIAMGKSPLLRYAVLSFALTYQLEKQDLITLDMKNRED